MARSLSTVAYRVLTCPVRLLPDFVVLGTIRGGTTAFYHYLTRHPGVGGATFKELHYFDRKYTKGPLWYRAHFPTEVRKHRIETTLHHPFVVGEATPHYLFNPRVPERVATVLPDAKLMVLLRNPVERAFSHYRLCLQGNVETRSFAECVAEEERHIEAGLDDYCRLVGDSRSARHSYLAHGLYAAHLQRWFRYVPRERLLIMKSEDFFADPAATLHEAFAFLGVPPDGMSSARTYRPFAGYGLLPGQKSEHSGDATTQAATDSGLDPTLREHLSAYFAPYNQELYDLLGRDMGWR